MNTTLDQSAQPTSEEKKATVRSDAPKIEVKADQSAPILKSKRSAQTAAERPAPPDPTQARDSHDTEELNFRGKGDQK